MFKRVAAGLFISITYSTSFTQETARHDLMQHNSLYIGEWDYRLPLQSIFLIRDRW
ncbi:MAG: hypothetical protein JWR38_4775 [Mucilaginibacter sp.]|nr:hypothetical protein [Mucilaginibacter sp.]